KPRLLHQLTSALADGSWTDLRRLFHVLAPLAQAYALGSILGAVLLAAIAYWLALTSVRTSRRHIAQHQTPKNQ
ncbi:MAG TPA: hypothetical protein VGL62_10095, partial [Vicinamibacterales bacterium]